MRPPLPALAPAPPPGLAPLPVVRPRLLRSALLSLALISGCGAKDGPAPADEAGDGTATGGDGSGVEVTPLSCDVASLPPRQLRLLTRVEYANTVEAIFSTLAGDAGAATGAACADDGDCDLRHESCEDDVCVALPCDQYSFSYAGSAGAVVVAGSFNGWGATAAAGGWPLGWDETLGLWRGTFTLPEGRSSYKLVLDGSSWITDPENPAREPDGYGGENNVLDVDCSDDAPSSGGGWRDVDPLADFPVESRPQHYAFDNSAEAGLVTATHLERYMAAAATLADVLVDEQATLLGCDPAGADCAAASLDRLLPLAFRRPPSAEERARYQALAAGAGFAVAARVALSAPAFLYRSELGIDRGDGVFALTDHELASALSYTLTAGPPDAALRAAAEAGALQDPAALAAEADRLLGSPAGRAQLARYGDQWLGTERLATATRQNTLYPVFSDEMRADLAREAGLTYAWAVTEGGLSLPALLTGRTVWVSPSTAALYGLPTPATAGLAEVPADRAGLVGWASVLAATAHSDQTSPVRRGLFVRTTLLCQELGAPPPEAGGVPDVDPDATTRERFEQHSDDPVCAGCHQHIDPIGFGLEAYDAIGAWRPDDNGHPIDSSGALTDVEGIGSGTSADFDGPAALGALLAGADAPARCAAQSALSYAAGRVPNADTACAIDALHVTFAAEGHQLGALWRALVLSESFRYRRPSAEEAR
jgi:hypothetical protein